MFSNFNVSYLSSVVVFLLAVIPALYKLLKPILEAKVKTEKNAHIKQDLEVGLKIANAVIPEMSVMAGLSDSDRKKEAIRFVTAQLQAKGINLDVSLIEGLVEQAYQYYKNTLKGDVHKIASVPQEPQAPVEAQPSVEPAKDAAQPVSQAPAQSDVDTDGANEVKQLQGDAK